MNIITIILISILGLFTLVFLYDISQKHDTIWRNFPVVGHFRNIFISIGAAIRQYWVASDKEEMPFNRHDRNWVYATSKKQNNNFGFGTTVTGGGPLIYIFLTFQGKLQCKIHCSTETVILLSFYCCQNHLWRAVSFCGTV